MQVLPNNLQLPPLDPALVAERLTAMKVEDMAGRRALAEPMPGALADAFAVAPDIKVGPFSVRRFRDGDFKLLKALGNPFYDFMLACIQGDKEGARDMMKPTGQPMWDLAYVFTRPAKEVAAKMTAEGVESIQAPAEEIFGDLRIAALSELLMAVIDQSMIYSTANIAYGQDEKEGQAGAANPPSSAAP